MTTTNEAVAGELRAELARQGLTASQLAQRFGSSDMTVGRRLRGQVPLTLDELDTICDALGLDPLEVLAAARGQKHRLGQSLGTPTPTA